MLAEVAVLSVLRIGVRSVVEEGGWPHLGGHHVGVHSRRYFRRVSAVVSPIPNPGH